MDRNVNFLDEHGVCTGKREGVGGQNGKYRIKTKLYVEKLI